MQRNRPCRLYLLGCDRVYLAIISPFRQSEASHSTNPIAASPACPFGTGGNVQPRESLSTGPQYGSVRRIAEISFATTLPLVVPQYAAAFRVSS